jgi:hypothetical protein
MHGYDFVVKDACDEGLLFKEHLKKTCEEPFQGFPTHLSLVLKVSECRDNAAKSM